MYRASRIERILFVETKKKHTHTAIESRINSLFFFPDNHCNKEEQEKKWNNENSMVELNVIIKTSP